MGVCCSNVAGRPSGIVRTSSSLANTGEGPNDAVELFLKSRGYHGPFSQVDLSFSAMKIRDTNFKSDYMVVIYMKGKNGILEELGRTEVLRNSLSPTWVTKLNITYLFEVVQDLVFRVYDVGTQFCSGDDVKMPNLEEQQLLGEATCALSAVVTKPNRSLTLDLVYREGSSNPAHTQNFGQFRVCAEECVNSKTTIELIFRCSDLEYKDFFLRTDHFLVISKMEENGNKVPICKTDDIKNDPKPTWKPINLNLQQVGSKENPLIIECFSFNSSGKHDLVGEVQKSLADLEKLHSSGLGEHLYLSTSGEHTFPNKILKSQLFVDKLTERVQYTFLDYLAAGWELNFMVALDFTASNGNPRLPDSLHYIDPSGRSNAYQRAILEIGEVLQFYDSDRRFPAWGFGARPIDGPVSHCFNLNGSNNYCEVDGLQGIMTAYASALFNVSLAGPTLFGPVISNASLIASQALAKSQHKYFVLLIITDGVITDLQETKDAIVKASDLPFSMIIIGVGGADFKEMEVLDGNKRERLQSSTGRVASRDIVQFFCLRDVQSKQNGGEISVAQSLLAELPTQFLTYMRSRDIFPNS